MKFIETSQKPEGKGDHSEIIPVWLLVIIFSLPALIYIPGILGKIPFPSLSAQYNDLLLTHYPNALYLKNTILEFRQIPLWSTFIHSGTPFAANPLSGIFYLPGWLALIFPLPEGISATLALHAVFAAWGMYLFLKSEGAGEIGALSGGVILALMPKLAAHYGAGHVSLLYAISWTPWLFFISNKDRYGWSTGVCGALLFLADPRWAVYAGLIWLSYRIAHRQFGSMKDVLAYYLKAGITASLIAAPLILPLYEYIGLSTRASLGVEDIQAFSLSPEMILGLVMPTGGSNPEWYLYFGGTILGLFIIQLTISSLRKRNRFWNIWILISLVVAFGSSFINPGWIVNLPILSLLRVPARSLFLMGFSFAVVAPRSLELMFSKRIDHQDISKSAFGIAAAAIGLGVPINILLGRISIQSIWGFGFLFMLALVLLMRKSVPDGMKIAWIITGLLVIDLLGAGFQSFYFREQPIYEEEIISIFKADPSSYRIYSPSYSMPQWVAVENQFEITDGVDPMHLAEYSEFMERASGVEVDGYSVTIPQFDSGNPAGDNSGAVPDAYLLSLLNVKYIISEFEIDNPDLVALNSKTNIVLYENRYSAERAWVEVASKKEGHYQDLAGDLVSNLILSPNKIELAAHGPGRLVLSEIQYPGWKVTVDGENQYIETAYGLLRSVNLLEGDHKVVFYFQPLTVYCGLGLALMGWLLAVWQISRKRDG